MIPFDPREFEGSRARWLRGLCPCCGGRLCEWEWRGEVHEPAPIGEGVMLCGRCIGNEHHLTPEFVPLMLASLVPLEAGN